MGITVIGTTNLAPKRRITEIKASTLFPGRWVAVDASGGYVEIDPSGTVGVGGAVEGAYQVCRKVENAPGIGTLVYQYGVIAYSEEELF